MIFWLIVIFLVLGVLGVASAIEEDNRRHLDRSPGWTERERQAKLPVDRPPPGWLE